MRALALERQLRDLSGGAPIALRPLFATVMSAGAIDGAVVGSFACDSWARARLILFAGVKVPLLLLATAALCMPGFFALNAVAGVGHAFRRAARAIVAGQAAVALSLASLSPFVLFCYLSGVGHAQALLVNAFAFACASACGQIVMHRYYRALIAEDPRHRRLFGTWIVLYALVGTQMGWLLRPFVGAPDAPVTFFRNEPFSNAYVVVAELVVAAFR